FVDAGNPLGPDDVPATGDDGLRLTQFSDAVNAGDNSAAGLAGITEDYTGANRIFSGVVDMGAYERAGIILPDFDFVWLVDWPGFQPPCLTCPLPWSFVLFREFEFEPQYIWKEPAQFVRKGNSAVVTGEIVNAAAPEISFKVYLKLDREHTWETWSRQQGSWFSKTSESEVVAKTGHVNWKFWKLSASSFIEGTGEIEGILKLKQWNSSEKTGFQMGMGANAWDGDFGMAGYFNYNGKLTFNGKKQQVRGLGSFNVDGIPCEEDCEEQFVQHIMEPGQMGMKSAGLPAEGFANRGIHMYPVPADEYLMLESAGPISGTYTIKILDASGRILLTEKWDHKEVRHAVGLNKLKSGLHFIQMVSGDAGEVLTEKFMKK
ncbi:MAG: T9SS type A sorting domain-containing protein, partial [Mariniphaga sp.]